MSPNKLSLMELIQLLKEEGRYKIMTTDCDYHGHHLEVVECVRFQPNEAYQMCPGIPFTYELCALIDGCVVEDTNANFTLQVLYNISQATLEENIEYSFSPAWRRGNLIVAYEHELAELNKIDWQQYLPSEMKGDSE